MTSAPWPLWTIAIPPAFALMMLVGIYLYRRMNKRIDDHPVCRKCKFDLFGAPAGSARCPECGADVATKNAVVIGNRVSSVMGRNFATVLICVGLLGSLFVGREVYKRVNFQPIKPDWWLLMELNSKSFWMQEAAINTLFERIKKGEVSETNCLALERFILLSMTRSNSTGGMVVRNPPSRWQWMDNRIVNDPNASPERLERLSRMHLGEPKLKVREKVAQGDPLPVQLRCGNGLQLEPDTRNGVVLNVPFYTKHAILVGKIRYRIDAGELRESDFARPEWNNTFDLQVMAGFGFVLPSEAIAGLSPGKHRVEVDLNYDVVLRTHRYVPSETLNLAKDEFDPKQDRFLARINQRDSATFEVLSPGISSVKMVKDDSASSTLQRMYQITTPRCRAPGGYSSTMRDVSAVPSKDAESPVGVAFDIVFRQNGHELKMGTLSVPNKGRFGSMALNYPSDAAPGPGEVIFRTNPAVAKRSIDVFEIWDGETVIPVTLSDPQPSATQPISTPATPDPDPA